MKSRYELFFEILFKNEGGFQRDPDDKGNYYKGLLFGTIYGITARDHFEVFQQIKKLYDLGKFELAKHQAMLFYERQGYWNVLYNQIHDSSLAFKLFDFGVNSGVRRSIKILQRILKLHWKRDLKVDGVFGKATLAHTNYCTYKPANFPNPKVEMVLGESVLYAYYIYYLEQKYRSFSTFWKFGVGWLRRLAKVVNVAPDLYYRRFGKQKHRD